MMIMELISSILLLLLSLIILEARMVVAFQNETDYQALIAFKNQVSEDPLHVLSSWNDSILFCDWKAVTCSTRHQRVMALNLSSLGLAGALPPQIGNLSFLRTLDLNNNSFHGSLPEEICRLSRLQTLSLENNSFRGELPRNLTHCADLSLVTFSGNNFKGRIPEFLGTLSKLASIGLTGNLFTGGIPASIRNLSLPYRFYIADNLLTGSIPPELGKLSNLAFLQLSINNLTGPIPECLYNISSMVLFSMAYNNLSGTLPPDLFLRLPRLQGFYLGINQFSGTIPPSIANASELVQIDLAQNSFHGSVPPDLGGLDNLQLLSIGGNLLGTEEGDDLSFLNSLANCSNLRLVWLPLNHLKGTLAPAIANFSSTFTSLRLDQNLIHSSLPLGIGDLQNLELLYLSENMISGSIPESLGKLSRLKELWLNQNNITGKIPLTICNASSLNRLILRNNVIEGSIPSSLANCRDLIELDLSHNHLVGSFSHVFGLTSLSTGLSLSNNDLSGSIPPQVGSMVNLMALDLSENSISGEIPTSLGNCVLLQSLTLQGNKFGGSLPATLRNLKGAQVVNLARNNLSGQIPDFLRELPFLLILNLSFNMFEGQVPQGGIFSNLSAFSVEGNERLCGGAQELVLPKCPETTRHTRKNLILPLSISLPSPVILACIFGILFWGMKSRRGNPTSSTSGDHLLKISYSELHQATAGFTSANLIGEGSFGAVYKGTLPISNEVVAVKVLKLQEQGANKSFMAECEVLRNIRHRNLVKIITSCSSVNFKGNDFKALVFEFMPNGSLEEWLHRLPAAEGEEQPKLSVKQRLQIAIDVAIALDYLHNQCEEPVVHCDLKPSNVLLDCDFCEHLCDFSLAKLFSAQASRTHRNSIAIRGTIGYVAPEYGAGGEVSKQGDVYSFGILLLELFTGKRPTDRMFADNFTIHDLVKTARPEHLTEVVDPGLQRAVADSQENGSRNMRSMTPGHGFNP